MDNRNNNFDFLRLFLATCVIITHSYPLSGIVECDFLCQLSNNQISFSYIGVKGFFVVSGYLIFQSLQRSVNIIDYFWKRFLRLFPGLLIVLILTIILIPFVYQGKIPLYNNKSLLTYIPNNLSLYRTQYVIDGVFETNPYKSVVNGSLWTIPYEFTMYILLSSLIIFRKNIKTLQIILLISFSILFVGNVFYFEMLNNYYFLLSSGPLLDLGVFFVAGSLMAAINIENTKRKKELFLIMFSILIFSFYFNFYNYSKYITLPILFIIFGLIPIKHISSIGNKIGDLSYGIYIYGFLIQQTLMYYFKLNYIELMISSLILSYIFAYFSWHVIEKNALRFKKILQ